MDIVITSYNRPYKVVELARAIYRDSGIIAIVVDSGKNDFSNIDFVNVVRSSHKNQPYQRYLGYLASKSDWLLFLDDDMEPIEGWIDKIQLLIMEHNDKGVIGIHFEDKHTDTFLKKAPRSFFEQLANNRFTQAMRSLSGYPILLSGKYYKNGVKGALPKTSGWTEHSSGGAFLAQKKFLYQNFNMQLFDLYEQRMGKGEDGILSYTVSKMASLHYCAEQLFWHNDQGNSVYTQNQYRFNKVVAFSRAYLNFEYYRLNQIPLIFARFSYFNYGFWRFMGLLINFLIKPSQSRRESLKGNFIGWMKGVFINFNSQCSRNSTWYEFAKRDLDESTI